MLCMDRRGRWAYSRTRSIWPDIESATMHHIDLSFEYIGTPNEADVSHAVFGLLASWANNGQILGSDWTVILGESCCRAVISCPETTSLNARYPNQHARKDLSALKSHGLTKPKVTVLGPAIESPAPDKCKKPAWYILTTHYLTIESPLRCGEHGLPVPLYRIPATYEADPNHWGIRCWQSDWKSFDQLQMGCGFGERWATKQISDPRSPLSATGREICADRKAHRRSDILLLVSWKWSKRVRGTGAAVSVVRPKMETCRNIARYY